MMGLRPADPWSVLIGLAGQRLLNFLNLYQVLHLTDHTQYLRSGFHFLGSVKLVETQRFQGQFLTLRPVDAALDLCYLDLCHSLIGLDKSYPLKTFFNDT